MLLDSISKACRQLQSSCNEPKSAAFPFGFGFRAPILLNAVLPPTLANRLMPIALIDDEGCGRNAPSCSNFFSFSKK